LLFEEGNDVLKRDAATEKLLQKVIVLTENLPYSLSIEGHTDDTPISNLEFGSNWELSSNRAIAVLEYFVGQGVVPERLQAVGHGSFKPYASNQTLRGRKLNRRVEINLDVTRGL
jgi:chemotaxis protein MotB